jgi:hypothetical protein
MLSPRLVPREGMVQPKRFGGPPSHLNPTTPGHVNAATGWYQSGRRVKLACVVGETTRDRNGSRYRFQVETKTVNGRCEFVIVSPAGTAMYSFSDAGQAEAEAAMLNEPEVSPSRRRAGLRARIADP